MSANSDKISGVQSSASPEEFKNMIDGRRELAEAPMLDDFAVEASAKLELIPVDFG